MEAVWRWGPEIWPLPLWGCLVLALCLEIGFLRGHGLSCCLQCLTLWSFSSPVVSRKAVVWSSSMEAGSAWRNPVPETGSWSHYFNATLLCRFRSMEVLTALSPCFFLKSSWFLRKGWVAWVDISVCQYCGMKSKLNEFSQFNINFFGIVMMKLYKGWRLQGWKHMLNSYFIFIANKID